MKDMFTSFKECDHRKYFKGCKIGNDPSYPCSAWGHYLPGDEPGHICSITDIHCDEREEILIDSCGRLELTTLLCPLCKEEDEKDVKVYYDIDDKDYMCPECSETYKKEDLIVPDVKSI